jgi:hypothetical protein
MASAIVNSFLEYFNLLSSHCRARVWSCSLRTVKSILPVRTNNFWVQLGGQAPSVKAGRWHRPKLYGTIVAIYFLAMGAYSTAYLIMFLWYDLNGIGTSSTRAGPAFEIAAALLVAISLMAAFHLIRDSQGEFVKGFQYAALIVWSLIAFSMGAIFIGFALWTGVLMAFALILPNLLMYICLKNLYSRL